MANKRLANTFYIDTQYSTGTDELASQNIKVRGVLVTASAAGGNLVLSDAGLGVKMNFKVATDEDSSYFDFSLTPVVFSTSIRPTTLSGCVATVFVEETKG